MFSRWQVACPPTLQCDEVKSNFTAYITAFYVWNEIIVNTSSQSNVKFTIWRMALVNICKYVSQGLFNINVQGRLFERNFWLLSFYMESMVRAGYVVVGGGGDIMETCSSPQVGCVIKRLSGKWKSSAHTCMRRCNFWSGPWMRVRLSRWKVGACDSLCPAGTGSEVTGDE